MNRLTDLAIGRPVATRMVYLILIVVGLVSFRLLPVDLLPSVEFTQLTVRVSYPNAAPTEVERIITDPIENAVAGLPNLTRVTSRSEEGSSRVRLEFARGTNIDEAANDLRAALDDLRDVLPVEAEAPRVFKLDLDQIEVVNLVATSTHGLEELTHLLEDDISRRFEQIPGVGAIELRGGIYREIRVELDRDRLMAAGLTASEVRETLARQNVLAAGGSVKSGLADLYVRPEGEYRSVDEISRTIVTSMDGLPVRVRDVARVTEGHEDVRYLAEVNGVPCVSLRLQKQSGANTVAVAGRILEEAERINAERDDIHLTIFSDQSAFIRQSIGSVRNAALWGSLLAMAVLYAFIRSRSGTAIIATAIPISVVATFGLLYFGGQTLNQMTFGGLALGVGMIVDSAIVVLESIVRKREEDGEEPVEAARHGTRDVAGAVLASTLTSCVIFVPVVFSRTTSGAMFQALALVVVFALACSLIVALTLVPMLAARSSGGRGAGPRRQSRFARVETRYVGWLDGLLHHRARTFAVTGALLAAAVLAWPLIPVELAPQTDANEIDVEIEMAQGTNMAVVREYVQELEDRVRVILPPGDLRLVSTEVRGGDAEVEVQLMPQHLRSTSSQELADRLRAAVDGQIPGAEISVDAQPGLWILRRIFSSGEGDDAIEIELRGWDLEETERVAAEIERRVSDTPGVTDVRVRRREGRPEQRLAIDRERVAELGLSVADVVGAVQANVGGVQAGRLREGGREYPIVVRLRPEDRLTGDDLRNVSLRTDAGEVVPLSLVVSTERNRGPTSIRRVDGQRVTYITAGLESGVALGDAVERIRESLASLELPRDVSIVFGGQYREQLEARRDFVIAIAMALLLVYMLMAAQFERYLDPLIVMVSVPVALIGVVPALLLTGTTLNIQSVMGLVMLIGIVVNNAIVLVDAINLLRRERGLDVRDAVIEAARLRLRPILMTTLTTVLGLLPLAIGIGPGAEVQASLARVVVGGLLASTLVTLALIPVTYDATSGLAATLQERGPRLPWRRRRAVPQAPTSTSG
ncbi:MAG TPA: efflux RND transporter permease subunit [bacterium]|nr:efflux RND transporter permease subunit [bacterium]